MCSEYRGHSGSKWYITRDAVNIGDIVGVSGGQPTKGAANIGDIGCKSRVIISRTIYPTFSSAVST